MDLLRSLLCIGRFDYRKYTPPQYVICGLSLTGSIIVTCNGRPRSSLGGTSHA